MENNSSSMWFNEQFLSQSLGKKQNAALAVKLFERNNTKGKREKIKANLTMSLKKSDKPHRLLCIVHSCNSNTTVLPGHG